MKVHFVCTGNTYRSRLAEAYLNSKNLKNIQAYSSGIEAEKNLSGPIGWVASRLIYRNSLVNFMTTHWRKTDEYLVGLADHTVFMENVHLYFCKNNYNFNSPKHEVWNILDLESGQTDMQMIQASEKTFEKIKQNVDELVKRLSAQPNL